MLAAARALRSDPSLSFLEVERSAGLSRGSLRRALREEGVPANRYPRPGTELALEARRLVLGEGLSSREAAKRLGVTRQRVDQIVNRDLG